MSSHPGAVWLRWGGGGDCLGDVTSMPTLSSFSSPDLTLPSVCLSVCVRRHDTFSPGYPQRGIDPPLSETLVSGIELQIFFAPSSSASVVQHSCRGQFYYTIHEQMHHDITN